VSLLVLSPPTSAGFAQEEGAAGPQRVERTEVHMGTEFKIIAYGNQPEVTQRAITDAFARIAELDSRLSDYDSSSELSQLSLSAPHPEWCEVSHDLWNVLVESQRVSHLSGGAFDITLGPLTRIWRRARRRQEAPSTELLEEARQAAGYKHLLLREPDDSIARRKVRLLRPQMRLDLGGIAKGYAVEEGLRALHRWGIDRALVDGGGDLAVGAPPPGESGWRIGIAPLQADAGPSRFVRLSHRSIATSGDYWQYIEIDGIRYSHILDPRTGRGVTRRSTVTVIARRGSLADALASAVSVLGPRQGMELVRNWEDVELLVLAESHGTGGQVARSTADPHELDKSKPRSEPGKERQARRPQVQEWSSPGFARYLELPDE
jgi:FAD:protein FMN transferase